MNDLMVKELRMFATVSTFTIVIFGVCGNTNPENSSLKRIKATAEVVMRNARIASDE